jgi:flagellar biosynthesis/type III secretory pathway M-ring protein FliF/YscJ
MTCHPTEKSEIEKYFAYKNEQRVFFDNLFGCVISICLYVAFFILISSLLSRLTRRLFRAHFQEAEKKRKAEEQAREYAPYIEHWRKIDEHIAKLSENNNKETSESDDSKIVESFDKKII